MTKRSWLWLCVGGLTGCTLGFEDLSGDAFLGDSGFFYDDPAGDGSGYDDGSGDNGDNNGNGNGGGESSGPEAPEIQAFTATVHSDYVRFDFVVDDPDDDLNGGDISITVGPDSQTYPYPQGLSWSGSTASVEWPAALFDYGGNYTGVLQATDVSGNYATETATFTTDPWTAMVTETCDLFVYECLVRLGQIETPAEISGSVHTTGAGYTGDVDVTEFVAPSSGTHTFELTWTATADYDFLLYLGSGGDPVAEGSTRNNSYESVSYNLVAGSTYFFGVAGWSGGAGEWTVHID